MTGQRVLYLALGPYRIPAATEHAARLRAQGARVQLVVGDFPQWDEIELPPGVTVHRLGPGGSARSVRRAQRLVAGRDGLARDADLLVAGDPQALPVAAAALRHHRDLPVRTEPGEAGREVAAADLAVVTPWYPSPNNPLAGAFVAAATAAAGPHVGRVSILHPEDSSYPADSYLGDLVEMAMARVAGRFGPVIEDRPEGELARVMVPVTDRLDYTEQALARLEAVRRILPTGQIEAPLVHGHTGIYGGLIASRLARPDARVVVTEHASFLPRIFRQAPARRLYADVLQRAETMICVSQYLYDQVAAVFPQYAHKLRLIPNVIDLGRFPPRPSPPEDLLRWLYVGRLLELKQLPVLLEAFARVAAWEPRVTLTLVGSGPLKASLADRAEQLGLADRVSIRPPVPPEAVAQLMHDHDLLVHPSRMETFGMTVVEAIATGTPVLAARSPGPAETLAGVETLAGRLVEVSPDPDVLVTGYRRLRSRLGELDLPAAREALVSRYQRDTVVGKLLEVYAGTSTARLTAGGEKAAPAPGPPPTRLPDQPPAAADRVVLVAIDPPSYGAASDFVNELVKDGLAVDLVTGSERLWNGFGQREWVRLHVLEEAERRLLIPRIEQLLIYRAPGKALHIGRQVTGRLAPVWPEQGLVTLQAVHRRLARACHFRLFNPVYRAFRPRILWRLTRREILPKIDLSRTRCVVVAGPTGVTIGSRLGARKPELPVTSALDRALV